MSTNFMDHSRLPIVSGFYQEPAEQKSAAALKSNLDQITNRGVDVMAVRYMGVMNGPSTFGCFVVMVGFCSDMGILLRML